jgi:hypothetical protein
MSRSSNRRFFRLQFLLHDRHAPLPVLRVKLADADKTWLYVDPQVGQVVGRVNT